MIEFGTWLRELRLRAGLSGNALARTVEIDPGYLNRIERGEREPPRRPVVEAMATALALTGAERDGLLAAAGYLPAAIERLGVHDATLRLVADILADDAIPATGRAEFRQVIALIARRWRPAAGTAGEPGAD